MVKFINLNEIALALLSHNHTYEMFYHIEMLHQQYNIYQLEVYENSRDGIHIATIVIDRDNDIVSSHICAYSGNDNDFDSIDIFHITDNGTYNGIYLESIVTGEIVTIRKPTVKKAAAVRKVTATVKA